MKYTVATLFVYLALINFGIAKVRMVLIPLPLGNANNEVVVTKVPFFLEREFPQAEFEAITHPYQVPHITITNTKRDGDCNFASWAGVKIYSRKLLDGSYHVMIDYTHVAKHVHRKDILVGIVKCVYQVADKRIKMKVTLSGVAEDSELSKAFVKAIKVSEQAAASDR